MSTEVVRHRRITAALNLEGTGIEYGPLHRVIVRKEDRDVRYVDYADRAALMEHYRNDPNVDVDLIPEIDVVTHGRLITEFLGAESLDYVVASHVMEHVPNMIGWLESNLRVLKRGGRIGVAYPDKRYCFDLKRRSSAVSDLLAAYFEDRDRPSAQQIADHFWNVVKANPAACWSGEITPQNAEYIHERATIIKVIRNKILADRYIDCHCWIFTDEQLIRRLKEVRKLLSIPFEIVAFLPTQQNTTEFYFTLERTN